MRGRIQGREIITKKYSQNGFLTSSPFMLVKVQSPVGVFWIANYG